MKLELESYGSVCLLSRFTINGLPAYETEFVAKYDHDTTNAVAYCCGDMRCDILPIKPQVLSRYGITEIEYEEIAQKISKLLSFGCCGWCS